MEGEAFVRVWSVGEEVGEVGEEVGEKVKTFVLCQIILPATGVWHCDQALTPSELCSL